MGKLGLLYHIVHPGFDESDQPDYEQRVISRLDEIKTLTQKGLNVSLVFVDEPKCTYEESELYNLIKIAEAISTFMGVFNNISWFPDLESTTILKFQDKTIFPDELLSDLFTMLNETVQLVKKPVPRLREFICGKEITESEIESACKEQDKHIIHFQSDLFLDVLKKLWLKYKGKNIFGIKYVEELEMKTPANIERRNRIYQYAVSLFGSDSIINTYMRDGDINSLGFDYKYYYSLLSLAERSFGNADLPIQRLMGIFHIKRIRGYIDSIDYNLKSRGMILDQDTLHLIGGEYFQRCVDSYGLLLDKYFIKKNGGKIIVDNMTSLVKQEDLPFLSAIKTDDKTLGYIDEVFSLLKI